MTWHNMISLPVMLILLAGLTIVLWATGGSKRNPQAFDALKGITILVGVIWVIILLYKLNWPANAGDITPERTKKQGAQTLNQAAAPSQPRRGTTPQEPPPEENGEIVVRADEHFVDTGIKVEKGQKVTITALGQVTGGMDYSVSRKTGPDGWGEGCVPEDWLCGAKLMVHDPQASFMALCYKIGKGSWKHAGSNCQFITEEEGTLFLSTNDIIVDSRGDRYPDCWRKDNWGSFRVKVKVD